MYYLSTFTSSALECVHKRLSLYKRFTQSQGNLRNKWHNKRWSSGYSLVRNSDEVVLIRMVNFKYHASVWTTICYVLVPSTTAKMRDNFCSETIVTVEHALAEFHWLVFEWWLWSKAQERAIYGHFNLLHISRSKQVRAFWWHPNICIIRGFYRRRIDWNRWIGTTQGTYRLDRVSV